MTRLKTQLWLAWWRLRYSTQVARKIEALHIPKFICPYNDIADCINGAEHQEFECVQCTKPWPCPTFTTLHELPRKAHQ